MRLFLILFSFFCGVVSLYLIQEKSDQYHIGQLVLPQGKSPAADSGNQTPMFQSQLIKSSLERYSHAATLTELSKGKLLASWYAGSREGANDVNIYLSEFDPESKQWSEARVLMSSSMLGSLTHRHIRKLGNPVISKSADGRLWAFFVSVSLGGWAGSSINSMYSDDDGQTWSEPRRMVTSPFLNISTLVKSAPIYLDDGKILLPVYHEFIGKFSETLLLSPEGEVLEKHRITWGKHSLQPSIAALDNNTLLSLSRNSTHGDSIISATASIDTFDWYRENKEVMPNPNSAVSLLRLHDGRLLLAANDMPLTRNKLSLFLSDDGKSWQKSKQVEHFELTLEREEVEQKSASPEQFTAFIEQEFGNNKLTLSDETRKNLQKNMCKRSEYCEAHFSYPYFAQDSQGVIHLLYTWNKSAIKHAAFNTRWLEENLQSSSPDKKQTSENNAGEEMQAHNE